MSRARQYGFLRLDPQGDDYSDLYVPVEIIQWFENDDEVEVRSRSARAHSAAAAAAAAAAQMQFLTWFSVATAAALSGRAHTRARLSKTVPGIS